MTDTKWTKKMIMKRAWEIAREGQKKFGGKVSEYLSTSLKEAWEEAKGKKVYIDTPYMDKKSKKSASALNKLFGRKRRERLSQ